MSQLNDYEIIKNSSIKSDIFFKVKEASSLVFIKTADKSLIFTCSNVREHEDKLNELCSEILNYMNALAPYYEIKIVGPQAEVNFLDNFFKKKKNCAKKIVIRENGFDAFYLPQAHKVRLNKEKVKLLIVDDSKTIRSLLERIVKQDNSIEVVGSLGDPLEVEAFIRENRPDVITLDIHMPHLNGVDLLKKIYPKFHIPTIMISSISMEEGPQVLDALENGAFDYLQKPSVEELATVAPDIIEKIKAAANSKKMLIRKTPKAKNITIGHLDLESLVLIGSSTGGTEALKEVLTALPAEIPPVLIVQHIPPVFSKAFADRMNSLCSFTVKEAEHGELIHNGHVYVAPGGMHMRIVERSGQQYLELDEQPPVNRFRPSVDVLFYSAKENPRKKMIGVILTGMGKDGAKGLKELHDIGVPTIAQNEESCVVYGMPKAAVELGAIDYQIHLNDIAGKILELSQEKMKKVG